MILNYGEFLNEKEWIVTDAQILKTRRSFYAEAFTQFLNEDELKEANLLINEGLFDKLGFSKIERLNENELYESLVLEWTLLQKLKDKAQDAVAVVKDKGKKALSKVQQGVVAIGGKIGGLIKKIVESIKSVAAKAVDAAKKAASAAKKKMTEAFTKELNTFKNESEKVKAEKIKSLSKDTGNATKVSSHVVKWCTGNLAKETASAIAKGAKEEVPGTKPAEGAKESFSYRSFELMIENTLYLSCTDAMKAGELKLSEVEEQLNMLEEGGGQEAHKLPFISTISKFINKFPPFSVLKTLKEKGAEVAGGMMAHWSKKATKVMGAPGPFKFLAIGAFIGIAFELAMKDTVKALTASLLFPPAAPFISMAFNFAYVLVAIATLEVLVGTVLDAKDDFAKAKEDTMKNLAKAAGNVKKDKEETTS
tara:strand:+ start:34 stop:1299 length:1266 start_codon:yes stop_codon:yes gene_type:complete